MILFNQVKEIHTEGHLQRQVRNQKEVDHGHLQFGFLHFFHQK